MKMQPGIGSISDYGTNSLGCTLGQFPYKIPVLSLSNVQLYIDIGASAPGTVTYELIHTCGPLAGTVEAIVPGEYVIGQDTNMRYYGVFRNFTGATPQQFVIAITLDSQIYFSEQYSVETNPCAGSPKLIQGCYGHLNPLLSYDCQGQYFGLSQGGTMGDASLTYEHRLYLRNVEVTRSSIKNTFKQGRTRNFRTESVKIMQFWAEFVPEWYIDEVDAVFKRGEVYIDGVKYLVNETAYEKIEECQKLWKMTVTLKEECYQSFSCEADPCGELPSESTPPAPTCCDVSNATAEAEVVYVCGDCISEETTDTSFHIVGNYKIAGGGHVTITYDAIGRPNRFTVYENGSPITNSGWQGTAAYVGPWGPSLSTSGTGSLEYDTIPGADYVIRVEAGPADPMAPVSDNFTVCIIC